MKITLHETDFRGLFETDVIEFSLCTLQHNGSGGPCFLRAGTYGTPVANDSDNQSGMLRFYGQTSGDSSYDRGLFVALKTTGAKGIMPVAGLAEVLAQSGVGPTNVKAAEFIAGLHTSTSKLAALGKMFGVWAKVYSAVGSVAASTSVVAPLWVDSQMSGTVSGEEYGLYCSTGGTKPDSFIGFTTTSSGYNNFLSFDSTYASETMIGTATVDGGTAASYLKVNINGTAYALQLYHSW